MTKAAVFSRDFWVVLGVLFVFRCLVWAGLPFLVEGDGYTYFHGMIVNWKSHLLHPPGYPFLFGWVPPFARLLGQPTVHTLRVVQMIVPLFPLLLLYLALRMRVGKSWSAAVVLLIGTDFFQLTAAHVARPEFLQVSLLILLVAVVLLAEGRVFLWGVTGPIFFLAYLVKYNSLAFFPLVLLPVLDKTLSKSARAAAMGVSAAGATLLGAFFFLCFHVPSTGTWQLNLEHGVIHLKKLHASGTPVRATNGPATREFLVAMDRIPESAKNTSDPFPRIDLVDKKLRERFYLTLEAVPATSPPTEFSSSHVKNIFDLYRTVGLFGAEAMIAGVYREALAKRVGPYLRHSAVVLWDSLASFTRQYQPIAPVPEASSFFVPKLYSESSQPHVIHDETSMAKIHERWKPLGYYGKSELSRGILVFLTLFAWPQLLPPAMVWILLGSGLVLAYRSIPKEGWALALGLAFFLAGTALLFVFRNKEFLVVSPMISVLSVLSLRQICLEWTRKVWKLGRELRPHAGPTTQ